MLKNIQNEMAKDYEYVVLFLLMSKFNKLSYWQIIDEKAY